MSGRLPLVAIPSSVAVVEESRVLSGDKAIILIQDAHTNESAQINIARTLESIFEKNKDIRTIFLEAGTGDDSLSFLREGATRVQRERVTSAYLKKAWIQGADTFDLLSDKPVQLWGVEDKALYLEAIANYRAVREDQDKVLSYLDRVEGTIESVKKRILNPKLYSFDEKCRAFAAAEIPFTDHVELLYSEAAGAVQSLGFYPHLHALRALQKKELSIDFAKATEEQVALVQSLGENDRQQLAALSADEWKPFILDASEHKGEKAFYAFLREKIGSKTQYPNLWAYLEYLAEAGKIDLKAVLSEKEALEAEIYRSLTRTLDEEKLVRASRSVLILKKLFKLSVSNEEYAKISNEPRIHDIVEITGFLNKKILDLNENYEQAVFILPSYDTAFQKAMKFYELTRKRDDAFLKNALAKLGSDNEKSAVLIAGGYHAENLKKLFSQKGISYVSVRPQVLQETNQKKYENILLDQSVLSSSLAAPAQIATLPARELVVRDQDREVRVVAALSQDLGVEGIQTGARLADEPVQLSEILPGLAVPGLRASLDQKDLLAKTRDVLGALEELERETRVILGANADKSGATNRFADTAALLKLLTVNAERDAKFSFFSEDDWVLYTYLLENEAAFLRDFLKLYSKQRTAFMPAQYQTLVYEQALKAVSKRLEKLHESFQRALRTEERWMLERLRSARYREKLSQTTRTMKAGAVLLPVLLARGWEVGFELKSKTAAPKFDYRKSRTLSMNDLSRKEHPFHPDSYDGILSGSMMPQFHNTLTPLADLLKELSGAAQRPVVWADVGPGYGLALRQGKQILGERLVTYGADLIDWSKSLTARSESSFRYANRYGKDLFGTKNDYQFVRGSMEIVALPEKADLITAFYSMPYSEDPLAALTNFYNQLKPGGIFLASLFRYLVPSPDGVGLDHSDWVYQIAQELSRQGVEARVSGDVLMVRRKDERTLSLNLKLDAQPERDREDRVHLKYVKIDPAKPVALLSGARLAKLDTSLDHPGTLRQRFAQLSYSKPSKTNLVMEGFEHGHPEKKFYIKINLSTQGTQAGRQDLKELQAMREDKIRSELAKDSYLGIEDYLLRISPNGLWRPGELTKDDIAFIEASLSESKLFEEHKRVIHKGELSLEEGMPYTIVDEAMGESFEDLFGSERTAKELETKADLRATYEKKALRAMLDLVETHLVFQSRGFYQRDGSEFETFRSPDGRIQLIDFGLASKWDLLPDGSQEEVSFQDSPNDPDLRIRPEEMIQLKNHIFNNMIRQTIAHTMHPSFRDLITIYHVMNRFGSQLPVRSPVKSYLESKYAHFNPRHHQTASWHLTSLWMELRDLTGDGEMPVREHWFDDLDAAVLKKQVKLEELTAYLTAYLKVFSKVGKGRGADKSGRPALLTLRKGLAVLALMRGLKPDTFRWPHEEKFLGSLEEVDPKLDLLIHTFSNRKPGLDLANEADRKVAFVSEYLALVARNWWLEQKLNEDEESRQVENNATSKGGVSNVSFFVGGTIFKFDYRLEGELLKDVRVTVPSRTGGFISWLTRQPTPEILPNVTMNVANFFDVESGQYVQVQLSEQIALLRFVKRDGAQGARLAEPGQVYFHGQDVSDLEGISRGLVDLARSLDIVENSALEPIANEDGLTVAFKFRYQLAHGLNNLASQLAVHPELGIFPQYSTLKNSLDDLADTSKLLLDLSSGEMNLYQPISPEKVRRIITFSLTRHILSGIKSSAADKQFMENHRLQIRRIAGIVNQLRARLFFTIGNVESHEVNLGPVILERSREWLAAAASSRADKKNIIQFTLAYGRTADAGGFSLSDVPTRYEGDDKTFINYRILAEPERLDPILFKEAVSGIIEREFGGELKSEWERFFDLEHSRLSEISGARLAQAEVLPEGDLDEADARRRISSLLEHVVRNALAAVTVYPKLYLKESFTDEEGARQRRHAAFESLRSLKEFSRNFGEGTQADFRVSGSLDMITIANLPIQGLEGIPDGVPVNTETLKRLADFPAVSGELDRLISKLTSELVDFGMDAEHSPAGARKALEAIFDAEKTFNEFLKRYASGLGELPLSKKQEEPDGALAVLRLLHHFHELRQGLILGAIPIAQAQERIQHTLRRELKKIFPHRNLYYYTVRQDGDKYFLKLLVREPADTVVSRFEGREVELHGEKKEILEQYLKDARKPKRLLYYVPNRIEHFGYTVPMGVAVKSLFSLSPYVGKLHWQRLDMLLRDIVWYFPKAKGQKQLVSALDALSGFKNWLFAKGFGWVNKFMTVSVYGLIRVYLGASWADRINEILYVVIPDDQGRPVGLLMMHNWEIESERVAKLSVKQENLNKVALVLGHIGSRSEALNEWQKEQADFEPYLRFKGNLHDLKNRLSVLMGWVHSTASFAKKRIEAQNNRIDEKPYEDLKAAGADLEKWIGLALMGERRQVFERPGQEYLRASKAVQKMRAALREIEDPGLLEKIYSITSELLATPSEEVLKEIVDDARSVYAQYPETQEFFKDLIAFSEFTFVEYKELMALRKAMHDDRQTLMARAGEQKAFEAAADRFLNALEAYEKTFEVQPLKSISKEDRVQKGFGFIREEIQSLKRARDTMFREWPVAGKALSERPFELKTMKIAPLILRLKRAHQAQFEQSQIQIRTEGIDEWSETEVKADPEVLERFLREILTNAFKYSVAKASESRAPIPVVIGLDRAKKANYLRISVTDHGRGIPKEDQRFIGRLGFMSHPLESISYQVNGESGVASRSGTGLAVEGNRVKEMGSFWGFESEESEGSTFWVDVPIAGARLAGEIPAVPSPNTPRFGPESSTSAIFDVSPVVGAVLKKISNGEIQPIGMGVQFTVYESSLLPGYVLKIQMKSKQASRRFNITSLKTTPREQEGLYEDLFKNNLTVETKPIRVKIKNPQGEEGTTTVYLQKKVKLLNELLAETDPAERMTVLRAVLRGVAKFHERLWSKGFFDGDLRSLDGVGVTGENNLLRIIDYGFVYRLPADPEDRRRVLMQSGKVDEMSVWEFFTFNVLTRLKESVKSDLFRAYIQHAFPGTHPENLGDAARQAFDEYLLESGFEEIWSEFTQKLFPGIQEEEIREVRRAFSGAFRRTQEIKAQYQQRRDQIREDLEKRTKRLNETLESPDNFSPGYLEFVKRDHDEVIQRHETLDMEVAFESKKAFCEALRTEKSTAAFEKVLSRLPLGARLAQKPVNVPEGLRFFARDAENILSERLKSHVDTLDFAPRIESFVQNLRAAADAVEWNNAPLAAESMDRAMDAFYYMENWLGEAASTLKLSNLERLLAAWAGKTGPEPAAKVYFKLAFNRLQMASRAVYKSQDPRKLTPHHFRSLRDSVTFLMEDMEYNEDTSFDRLSERIRDWTDHSARLLTYAKHRKDFPEGVHQALFNDDGHLQVANEFFTKAMESAVKGARLAEKKRKPHPDLIHHDKKVEDLIEHIIRERNRTYLIHRFWPPAVVVFSSARIPYGHAQQKLGFELGKRMWERRFIPRTGGGPGNMRFVPESFIQARALEIPEEVIIDTMKTQVIRISLNAKEPHHPFGELFADYDHFVNRVHALYSNATGLLALHGGFGTVAEVLKAWRLELPLVLMGWEFWGPILQAFRESWKESGLLEDIDNIRITPFITDDIDDGLDRMLDPKFQLNYISNINGDLLSEANSELRTGLLKLNSLPPAVAFVGRPQYDSDELEIARSLMVQLMRAGVSVKPSTRGPVFNTAIEAAEEAGNGSKKSRTRMTQLLQPTLYRPPRENMKDKTKLGEKYQDWTKAERSVRNLISNSTILSENDGNHQIFYTYNTSAFVFLPGGVGTMDNLFDLIVAMQTGKIRRRPIILVGRVFWTRIFKALEEKLANYDPPLINPRSDKGAGDLGLFQIVGSVEEAKAILDALPKNGGLRGARLAGSSAGNYAPRQIAAMQHLMRLGVRWDKPAPKKFIHLGVYPGKAYDREDPEFTERMISKVQELSKTLYAPVGIHVMPSSDLPGILGSVFDGNSYIVSGRILRAKGIPFDRKAAEVFLNEMMETFGGTIGFGTKTRGPQPRPSTPATLFISQPGFVIEVDDAIQKKVFTNEFFLNKHVSLYYESPTFEKRLLDIIQWDFDDLDGQSLDVIKEKVTERYVDKLLKIAKEYRAEEEIFASRTGARLAANRVLNRIPAGYSNDEVYLEWLAFVGGDTVRPRGYLRAVLSDAEYDVISKRLGISDNGAARPPKTLRQVGEEKKLTFERVRQIELMALNKIRLAFLRYLEDALDDPFMRMLRNSVQVDPFRKDLSLRNLFASDHAHPTGLPKAVDYQAQLLNSLQEAGVPGRKALPLSHALARFDADKLRDRSDFFSKGDIEAIVGRKLFPIQLFADKVMAEEKKYEALKDSNNEPYFSKQNIETLVYQKFIPFKWAQRAIEDQLGRTRLVRFFDMYDRNGDDWVSYYKPLRDRIVEMEFSVDQANLMITTFKKPLAVAQNVRSAVELLKKRGIRPTYGLKHLLITRSLEGIKTYLKHRGLKEKDIQSVLKNFEDIPGPQGVPVSPAGARLAAEDVFTQTFDYEKFMALQRFLDDHEAEPRVNKDGTIYYPSPLLGIYSALDLLRFESGGSLKGKKLLDMGAGADLRVSFAAAYLFGMDATAAEKDKQTSAEAKKALEDARKAEFGNAQNITLLAEQDVFDASVRWADYDAVFFFYTEPHMTGFKLNPEFRGNIEKKLIEAGGKTKLILLMTDRQVEAGVGQFEKIKGMFSRPQEIRLPTSDNARGWVYIQMYEPPRELTRGARLSEGPQEAPKTWVMSLDPRRRFSVPAEWRERLSRKVSTTHRGRSVEFRDSIFSPNFGQGTLLLWPAAEYFSRVEALMDQITDPNERAWYTQILYPSAQPAELDKNGRIVIPDVSLRRAQLFTALPDVKKAEIVDRGAYLEVRPYLGESDAAVGARLAEGAPYEPLPSYATGLPMGTWNPEAIRDLVKDGLVYTEDDKKLNEEELIKKKEDLIEKAVTILMADTSQVNYYLFDLFEKLLFIPEWDKSMKDISLEIVRRVARQSSENILKFSDPIQIEAARRRLYFLAYIEHHPIKYQGWPFKDIFLVSQNQERLRTVHQELMRTVGEILSRKENEVMPGYGFLKSLEPVLVEKEKLNQYVFHRAKLERFESILQNGLQADLTIEGVDEKPGHIFFSDWLTSLGQINDFFDDGQFLHLRVRRDAPTVTESRIRGDGEFGDMASDFLGQSIPAEFVEIVDPYEPWKAYPIGSIRDIRAFYRARAAMIPRGARLADRRYEFEFEDGIAVDFSLTRRGSDKPKAVSDALKNYLAGYKNDLKKLWAMHEGDQLGLIRIGEKDRYISIGEPELDAFYGEVGAEKAAFSLYESEEASESGEAFAAGEIFFFDQSAQTRADTDPIRDYPLASSLLFDGEDAVVRAIEYRDAGTLKPMPLIHLEIRGIRRVWPLDGIRPRLKPPTGGYRIAEKGLDVQTLLKKYAPGVSVQFNGGQAQIKSIEIRDENGAPGIYLGIRGSMERYDEEWKAYSLAQAESLGLKPLSGARLADEERPAKNGRRAIDRYTRRLAYEIWSAKGKPEQTAYQMDSDWYVAERLIEDRAYFEGLNDEDLVHTLASRIWRAKYYPGAPQEQSVEQEKTDWYVAEHLAEKVLPEFKKLLGVYDAKRYAVWLNYALATLVQHEIGNELFIAQNAQGMVRDRATAGRYLEILKGNGEGSFLSRLDLYIRQYHPRSGPKFYYTVDAVTPIAGEYTPAMERERTGREVPRAVLAEKTNMIEIFAVLLAARSELAEQLESLEEAAGDKEARAIASDISETAKVAVRFISLNINQARSRVRQLESFGLSQLIEGAPPLDGQAVGARLSGGLSDDQLRSLTGIYHKLETIYREKIGFASSGVGLKAIPNETNDIFIFREMAGHAIHGYLTGRLDAPSFWLTLEVIEADIQDLSVVIRIFDEFLKKKLNSYHKTMLANEGGTISMRIGVGLVQSSRLRQFENEHLAQIKEIQNGFESIRDDMETLAKEIKSEGQISGARLSSPTLNNLEPFFIGVAHAHSSVINGSRLALDLKEDGSLPYIFTFTKEGESLIAKSEGISITLDRSKLKNGRTQKKIEDSLSIQDLRTLTDSTNNKITGLLDASGIDTNIPVILSIDLNVLDNNSSEFYLDYLIAELQALKRKDKNVFFILEGPEHLITQANTKDNTLFLSQVPQDLKNAPIVNLTPSTKTLNKSQVNVPVTMLHEGDIPAFKGLLALSTASGRISTKNIPQNYQDAYSTLAGLRLQAQDIKAILEGTADQKTILKGSLKPITKVAINKAIQLFKTMIRMVGAAA